MICIVTNNFVTSLHATDSEQKNNDYSKMKNAFFKIQKFEVSIINKLLLALRFEK